MSEAVLGILIAAVLTGSPGAQEPAAPRPTFDTQISAALVADVLPRRQVAELRPSVSLTATAELSNSVTARVDAAVEALVADRQGGVNLARIDVREAWIEMRGDRADLRAGFGRLVWGRLDEIAPTDVINPLDAARFLLEGRTEARLAVPFVRGRLTPSDSLSVEGVLVPVFRRGRFDRLAEASSPFNLVADALPANGIVPTVPGRVQRLPAVALRHVSGGARVQATAGRVDVAGSFYRGFDGLGPVTAEIGPYGPGGSAAIRAIEDHPRFSMLGVDVETALGAWAWRGEAAAFVERTFAAVSRPGLARGRSFDAGVGVDRRAGAFRLFGSVIAHRDWSREDPLVDRFDLNLVASVERSFGRERYLSRAFVVANPGDAAAFLRGLFVWRARDQLALEMSAGAFLGSSDDTIGRFAERDFLMGKVRAWF